MPLLTGSTFDDPRPELKKFRRGTLKKICRENGMEFDEPNATADDLRRIVASNDLDVSAYLGERHVLGKSEAASKAIEKLGKEKEALEERVQDLEAKFMALLEAQSTSQERAAESRAVEEGEMPESFEGLPIWRLRQLVKIAGIPFKKTDKAKDLIRKLNEHTA